MIVAGRGAKGAGVGLGCGAERWPDAGPTGPAAKARCLSIITAVL